MFVLFAIQFFLWEIFKNQYSNNNLDASFPLKQNMVDQRSPWLCRADIRKIQKHPWPRVSFCTVRPPSIYFKFFCLAFTKIWISRSLFWNWYQFVTKFLFVHFCIKDNRKNPTNELNWMRWQWTQLRTKDSNTDWIYDHHHYYRYSCLFFVFFWLVQGMQLLGGSNDCFVFFVCFVLPVVSVVHHLFGPSVGSQTSLFR